MHELTFSQFFSRCTEFIFFFYICAVFNVCTSHRFRGNWPVWLRLRTLSLYSAWPHTEKEIPLITPRTFMTGCRRMMMKTSLAWTTLWVFIIRGVFLNKLVMMQEWCTDVECSLLPKRLWCKNQFWTCSLKELDCFSTTRAKSEPCY